MDTAKSLLLVASSNPSSWRLVKEALADRFAIAYAVDLGGVMEVLATSKPSLIILCSGLLDADLDKSLQCMHRRAPEVRTILITNSQCEKTLDRKLFRQAVACLDESMVSSSLLTVVEAALTSLGQDLQPEGDPRIDPCDLESIETLDAYRNMVVGSNPRVYRMMKLARRLCATNVTVLINGESGTGKEVLARWIHDTSPRKQGPFETVDLPSIPDELFESILFGHEKGSFTGATAQNLGKFQKAHTGTLFLDEISCLKLELQPKLLRAIQEKEVESVGGRARKPCDVRIIAATNVSLERAVRRGTFRKDLFYRLNIVPLNMIPLRERPEDIGQLVDFFIKKHSRRLACPTREVSQEAIDRLRRHDWPGNIRELENRVQRALLLSGADQLGPEDLFDDEHHAADDPTVHFQDCDMSLERIEQLYISHVLERTEGNQSQAAQILQIDRKTLRSKLQKYAEQQPAQEQKLRSIS